MRFTQGAITMTEHAPFATCRRRVLQSGIDAFVAVVLGMLVWPFPIARATMTPFAQVVGIVVVIAAAQSVYFMATSALYGQTLGMRLAGMRLRSQDAARPTRWRVACWAAASSAIVWWFIVSPKAACRAQLAERLSGVSVDYEE